MINKPEMLRQVEQLSQDYYFNRISFAEYRRLRRELLKQIEAKYNSKN